MALRMPFVVYEALHNLIGPSTVHKALDGLKEPLMALSGLIGPLIGYKAPNSFIGRLMASNMLGYLRSSGQAQL